MKLLVADDHPLVRDALARTVRLVEPDAEVFEACDYMSTESQVSAHMPDLALVDLHMPGMDGMAGLQRLRELYPSMKLVVVSGDDDPATIRSALTTGIVGFLPKAESPEVLVQALRLILTGGTYLPSRALGDFRNGQAPQPSPALSGLTARQLDVLRLLMRGLPNKLIARELKLTEGTVKIHIAAILRGLHARNRTEAVIAARVIGMES